MPFPLLTGDRREILPSPAGGAPCVGHVPVFADIHQAPHGPTQPVPRQRRAQHRSGGSNGGAQAAHSARRKRLGEVRTGGGKRATSMNSFTRLY